MFSHIFTGLFQVFAVYFAYKKVRRKNHESKDGKKSE